MDKKELLNKTESLIQNKNAWIQYSRKQGDTVYFRLILGGEIYISFQVDKMSLDLVSCQFNYIVRVVNKNLNEFVPFYKIDENCKSIAKNIVSDYLESQDFHILFHGVDYINQHYL
jgi:hypothetical protein